MQNVNAQGAQTNFLRTLHHIPDITIINKQYIKLFYRSVGFNVASYCYDNDSQGVQTLLEDIHRGYMFKSVRLGVLVSSDEV